MVDFTYGQNANNEGRTRTVVYLHVTGVYISRILNSLKHNLLASCQLIPPVSEVVYFHLMRHHYQGPHPEVVMRGHVCSRTNTDLKHESHYGMRKTCIFFSLYSTYMLYLFLAAVDVQEVITCSFERGFFAPVPLIRSLAVDTHRQCWNQGRQCPCLLLSRLESSALPESVEPEYAGWLPTAGQIGVDGVAIHEGTMSSGWQLSLPQTQTSDCRAPARHVR